MSVRVNFVFQPKGFDLLPVFWDLVDLRSGMICGGDFHRRARRGRRGFAGWGSGVCCRSISTEARSRPFAGAQGGMEGVRLI
jgi:hypothetical protein